jgi:NAD(P)H-dependent FMN reductase
MKLLVVVASTRPGRIGSSIADWFVEEAREHAGFEVEVADLAELDLPIFDEPEHPSLGRYVHQHTNRWSAIADAADAFVFVMPEYNHSYNAALKNAIDYLNREWAYKPVGFVSYGGVSGGLRAVQAIKPVTAALRMTPVVDAVTIPMAKTMVDENGFHPSDMVAVSAKPMLDELEGMGRALRELRAARRAA